MLKSNIRNAFIGAAVLIVSVLCFMHHKNFIRYADPLPYILPVEYNKTLFQYINTEPSRHIYIVTGAAHSGKSSLLNNITKQLRENGILVIKFDFGKAASKEDVLGLMRIGVLESISDTDCASDSLFHGLSKFSYKRISTVGIFFDKVEELNKVQRVVIIAENVNRVREISPEFYNAAKGRLARRNQYADSVPIILESGDTSFLAKNIPDFYRVLSIDEFDSVQLKALVALHAFKQSELKKIKRQIGLHGGTIDSIFEKLRMDTPLDIAIQQEIQDIKEKVDSLKTQSPVLNRLCESKDKTVYVNTSDLESIIDLVRNGYIIVKNDGSIKTSNSAILQSLCN